jgi:hypothetical protein
MRQELVDDGGLAYAPCRYGTSKLWFRGPAQALDRPYCAFIGSTATYGKYIPMPFPALAAQETGRVCVNLGCVNGGVDAYIHDPQIMDICRRADMTVVQVMGANNLSNRFYSVHQRRNDRFLRASTILHAIYADVDFAEFTFTRHLLSHLHAISPERFDIVVHELRKAWVARMQMMLGLIGPQAVLLWFSADPLNDAPWSDQPRHLQADPLFVTAHMIDLLRPMVQGVIVVTPSDAALAAGEQGMCVPLAEIDAAAHLLGPACHAEAALAIAPWIAR